MSQQFSGSPLCPPTLHSESSSPPVEERKTVNSTLKAERKQQEASRGTEPQAPQGQGTGCPRTGPTLSVLTTPPLSGWGGVLAYPAPQTPWEQTGAALSPCPLCGG